MKPFLLSLIILASIVFQTVGVSAHHSPPNNEHPPRTALNMGTATGCHMAVEGKMPSAKGLVQNAVQALAQSVAHTCANEIGGCYVDNDVDSVSHKLLHAALGAGLGAAVSKNRTEGALVGAGSALAAELIAEMMGPSTVDLQSKARAGTLTHDDIEAYWEQVNDTADAARILTAGAVALTGKDTEAAVAASSNALDNNLNREQRWMELAEQPNSRLPKEVVDHVSRHKGKRVTSRFGLELAHKPKKSAAQGYDYSEALPKTTADHRGIEHRYLKERSTGTTISIPNKPASGKLQLPKKGSLPE